MYLHHFPFLDVWVRDGEMAWYLLLTMDQNEVLCWLCWGGLVQWYSRLFLLEFTSIEYNMCMAIWEKESISLHVLWGVMLRSLRLWTVWFCMVYFILAVRIMGDSMLQPCWDMSGWTAAYLSSLRVIVVVSNLSLQHVILIICMFKVGEEWLTC